METHPNPNQALWEKGDFTAADELHSELLALARAQNSRKGGGTSIPATFLRVTVEL
jgi:hypothetical protein